MLYKIILSLAISICCMTAYSNGQELELHYSFYTLSGKSIDQGISFSTGGYSIDSRLRIGAEFRSIDWGNQLSLDIAYENSFPGISKDQIYGLSCLHLGWALFRPSALFSPGVSYTIHYRKAIGLRSSAEFMAGVRYNVCPGYRKYGNYQQFEIPLALGFYWNLQ